MNNAREATNELHSFLKKLKENNIIHSGWHQGSNDAETTLKELCQKGANIDYLEKERGFSCIPNVFWSKRLIQFFIDRGSDVNSQDEHGDTALNLALRYGCYPTFYDDFDVEPEREDQCVIKFLLQEHSADPNIPNLCGETGLFTVAKDEFKGEPGEDHIWEEVVESLLENAADIETQNFDGESLLHLQQYYYCITDGFILRFEGDVDLRTSPCSYSQTPLMRAAREDSGSASLKCCELLIKKGANVNAVDLQGYTALHHALMMENMKNVKFLVDSGADPNLKTKTGKDAYELAILNGIEFTYGAEPRKQVEVFEMAVARVIMRTLDRDQALRLWREGMEICIKFDLAPSNEFLTINDFLIQAIENQDISHELYVAAMSTVARLCKGTQESKFWILLACLPLSDADSYVFETLINFSEEFKRIGEFASLEEKDFYTLSNLVQFFKSWLTRLIPAEDEGKKEICDHISYFHSVVSLAIACFEKRIQETNSKRVLGIYLTKTFRTDHLSMEVRVYSNLVNALTLVHTKFEDVLPKTDFERNDKLLRELMNLDLRDREGNNLMHIAIKSTNTIFDNEYLLHTVLDLGILDVRAKNEVGIEPAQTIYWEERESKEQFRKLLVKIAEMGAHVDARNPNPWSGQTLKEILEVGEQYSSFPYDNLQCMCARVLVRSLIPFKNRVPKNMVDFIRIHNM